MARRLILLFNQKGERERWGKSGNETRERTALVARGIGCRVMWWIWELACGYSLITSTLSFLPLIFFSFDGLPLLLFSFFLNAPFSPLYRIQAGLSLCICTFLKRIFKRHPPPFLPHFPHLPLIAFLQVSHTFTRSLPLLNLYWFLAQGTLALADDR